MFSCITFFTRMILIFLFSFSCSYLFLAVFSVTFCVPCISRFCAVFSKYQLKMSSNLLSSDTTCTFIRNCRFYGFTVMYFTLRLLGNYFLEKFLLFICMFICFCICFPFYIYYACFPFYIYSITSNDSGLLTVSFCL